MKRMVLSVVIVSILCVWAMAAQAAPSLEGYTGLMLVPSAETLDEKEFNVGYFALDVENGVDSDVWAGNLGVADNLELGITVLDPDVGDNETLVNMKYQFRMEDMEHPSLAVGAIDITDEIETTTYVVMSKTVPNLIKWKGTMDPQVHVGLAGGRLSGFMAGLSIPVGDKLMLMGEYDTEDLNFGATLKIGQEIVAHGGWLRDFDDVALGVSYNKSF